MERQSEVKHEYLRGTLFAMAGASRWHNLIVTNVARELSLQLKGKPCEVYPSDMRVRIQDTDLYTYPDIVVVCGTPRFEDTVRDTLLNPIVIIEVLSPSTEGHDRGAKFAHYRRIESLRQYVLITPDAPRIEWYTRQEESRLWYLQETEGLETEMSLESITCQLQLAEVFDKVEFDETERQKYMAAARLMGR
jgi:Uma2 family endonuclease